LKNHINGLEGTRRGWAKDEERTWRRLKDEETARRPGIGGPETQRHW